MRRKLLREVGAYVIADATITSDEHPRYKAEIKRYFPHSNHVQHRSVRGSLTGQGELKRTGFDPLFNINHTLAMCRDNLKRLARRTWCTTKNLKGLENELEVYMHVHNTTLIPRP